MNQLFDGITPSPRPLRTKTNGQRRGRAEESASLNYRWQTKPMILPTSHFPSLLAKRLQTLSAQCQKLISLLEES